MEQLFQGNKSRLAVIIAFFTNGALFATWVSRIPAIQAKLGVNEGALGLILLGISAGVLTALFLAGGVIARFGSSKVTVVGAVVICFILPILALISHPLVLWIVLFLFGGAMSTMDVAMNEQAVLVERNARRPLMSSFHAAYSIGGLAGALIGSGMVSVSETTPFLHFVLVSVVFCGIMIFYSSNLLPSKRDAEKKKSVFHLPERALWTLGVIAFCSAIAEGAMADWSGVYLAEVLSTDAAFAALGYAAFSLTMTVGRFFGDWMKTKWKPEFIVRAGGIMASLGFLAAVFTKEPIIALLGFASIGLGLSNIIPLSFSAAGNHSEIPAGTGIAGVATIGYAGFLAGPPFIGLIAEATSLRVSLFIITLLVGTLIFTSKAVSLSK